MREKEQDRFSIGYADVSVEKKPQVLSRVNV